MPETAQMQELTERQREIYEFIREKIESRGYGPTVREIGDAFKIKSPNGVMCHLKALQTKGWIKREGFSARAIQLVDYQRPTPGLPFVGAVAAGFPVSTLEQYEKLDFNQLFTGPGHFALKVQGQSMIEDHIEDGDYVVVRSQETANEGETVVAEVDGEITLKRFYRDDQYIRLEPANGELEPIFVDDTSDCRILGVLVGVLRKF